MLAKLSGRLRLPRAAPAAAAARRLLQEKAGGNASAERKKTFGEEDDPSRFRFTAPLNARKKGRALLEDPLWNKGTAFSAEERDRLGLRGFLPADIREICEQRDTFLRQMRQHADDPLRQNLMLQDLHNRNETLFHRVLMLSLIHI